MHIYMIYNYDYYNPRNGGGIRYTHNLINYLLKNGIKVTLIGVDLSNNKNVVKNSGPDTIYVLKNSDNALKFFIKLFLKVSFLKFEENSIIHAHRTYFLLPSILFHPKVPKVVTLHMKPLEFVRVEYPQYFKLVNKLHKIVESFCLKRINVLVAINEEVKQAYERRYPWINGKIKVIPGTGVDLEKFKPMDKEKIRKKYGFKPDEKIILFVGRLEKIKNLDFLIRSFVFVINEVPNAKLVIVGRGSWQENLVNLVKELNLESNVIFMGEINPEEMPEVYNCADVLALSSMSEASPSVVREALACGVPVVSTNVGDASEIITDPLLGAIGNEYDEKLFAEALIKTIEIVKAKPEKVKERCRDVALERFSFEVIAKKYVEIYRLIVKRR